MMNESRLNTDHMIQQDLDPLNVTFAREQLHCTCTYSKTRCHDIRTYESGLLAESEMITKLRHELPEPQARKRLWFRALCETETFVLLRLIN